MPRRSFSSTARGAVPKVLLGKRHQRHKFMPGKFVFPGGRVDPVDKLMPVARPLDPHAEAHLMKRLQRPSAAKAQAFALAAIRETFEETGLLLGVHSSDAAKVPDGPWSGLCRSEHPSGSERIAISSAAPSRRPAGHGGSTRASSPWMPAPLPIASKA